ncbi:DNA circularization protein, partial [Escherichia coli]
RYNASEQGTVEFTINVIPASDDTAPAVAEDTAAALEQKSGSAMNQLFNTLSDGWTVISDGLHDVQAMTDTISDKIDALENAVSGMGIVQDISAFTASFTALKGNAAALINAPRRMAESLAGMFAVLTGLPGDPSLSLTGKAGTPSGSLTTNRDSMAEQAMPQLYRTLSSLRYTLSEQDDPQRLIGLTPAAQKNIRLLRSVMQSATLVSQAQTLGKLLDQVIRQNTTHVQDTDRSGGLAWLESSADVQRINRDLSDAMEQQVLDLSAQGYTGTALALRDAGLALTEDLTTRSVHLPGAFQVMVRTTEPALVTLYRATGNSSRWQYFVRRNNIPDPVFVPGGRSVEVISEQQD